MSEYAFDVGSKISLPVEMVNIYEYVDYAFSFYGTSKYIYTMKDSSGNVFVWKTTSFMLYDSGKTNIHDDPIPVAVKKGDLIQISATVKEHSVYKDEKQMVLQRVKFSIIKAAQTKEELDSIKREEQLKSIVGEDFVWEMPYKQYKDHYSDCEVLAGSFVDADVRTGECAKVSVIIREGRLKNSGVRGMHFSGYQFINEEGAKITYRAVCEENALNRCKKEFPEHEWELFRIFDYRHMF